MSVLKVPLQHLRHFDHRLKPAAARPAKPALEELPRVAFIAVIPEAPKHFLDRLDLRVESFGHRVGDRVAQVGDDILKCRFNLFATLRIGWS